MLPYNVRLRKKHDIERVLKYGKKMPTRYVIIYSSRNKEPSSSRAVCIVGKKVHPLAVRRNKIKRWLREIAQDTISHMSVAHDVVFIARPAIRNVTSLRELCDSLSRYTHTII